MDAVSVSIPTRDYEDCPFREMWYDVGEKAKGEDEWEVLGLEGTE